MMFSRRQQIPVLCLNRAFTLIFARGSGCSGNWLLSLPNPGHLEGSMCRAAIRTDANTPGMAAASMVANLSLHSGRMQDMKAIDEVQEGMARIIDDELAMCPNAIVEVGNYTPRGRKRRSLHGPRRPVLSIKSGTRRWYLPGVFYKGEPFRVTRLGIVTRCKCVGIRKNHPQDSVVWEAPV